jgi:hypothetical protein
VAAILGVCGVTVDTWRSRFLANSLDGLVDDPRPGTPRTVTHVEIERVVTRTLETKPKAVTHWSSHLYSLSVNRGACDIIAAGPLQPVLTFFAFADFASSGGISTPSTKRFAFGSASRKSLP